MFVLKNSFFSKVYFLFLFVLFGALFGFGDCFRWFSSKPNSSTGSSSSDPQKIEAERRKSLFKKAKDEEIFSPYRSNMRTFVHWNSEKEARAIIQNDFETSGETEEDFLKKYLGISPGIKVNGKLDLYQSVKKSYEEEAEKAQKQLNLIRKFFESISKLPLGDPSLKEVHEFLSKFNPLIVFFHSFLEKIWAWTISKKDQLDAIKEMDFVYENIELLTQHFSKEFIKLVEKLLLIEDFSTILLSEKIRFHQFSEKWEIPQLLNKLAEAKLELLEYQLKFAQGELSQEEKKQLLDELTKAKEGGFRVRLAQEKLSQGQKEQLLKDQAQFKKQFHQIKQQQRQKERLLKIQSKLKQLKQLQGQAQQSSQPDSPDLVFIQELDQNLNELQREEQLLKEYQRKIKSAKQEAQQPDQFNSLDLEFIQELDQSLTELQGEEQLLKGYQGRIKLIKEQAQQLNQPNLEFNKFEQEFSQELAQLAQKEEQIRQQEWETEELKVLLSILPSCLEFFQSMCEFLHSKLKLCPQSLLKGINVGKITKFIEELAKFFELLRQKLSRSSLTELMGVLLQTSEGCLVVDRVNILTQGGDTNQVLESVGKLFEFSLDWIGFQEKRTISAVGKDLMLSFFLCFTFGGIKEYTIKSASNPNQIDGFFKFCHSLRQLYHGEPKENPKIWATTGVKGDMDQQEVMKINQCVLDMEKNIDCFSPLIDNILPKQANEDECQRKIAEKLKLFLKSFMQISIISWKSYDEAWKAYHQASIKKTEELLVLQEKHNNFYKLFKYVDTAYVTGFLFYIFFDCYLFSKN